MLFFYFSDLKLFSRLRKAFDWLIICLKRFLSLDLCQTRNAGTLLYFLLFKTNHVF